MFDKFNNLTNPGMRALVGSVSGFGLSIVLCAGILGITNNSKSNRYYQNSIFVIMVSTIVGGVIATLIPAKGESLPTSQEPQYSQPKPEVVADLPENNLPEHNEHQGTEKLIFLRDSNKNLIWQADQGSILELAESNGINLPHSCREGCCLTCMAEVQEGEITYPENVNKTAKIYIKYTSMKGCALICIARPLSDRLVLEA